VQAHAFASVGENETMGIFRYALIEYRAPSGMLRGYFGAIRDFGEWSMAQPGDVMPVCVRVGAVPRLMSAYWNKPGTTLHARRSSVGLGHGTAPEIFARSRTYGPLYHRRQRCLVPASGYYQSYTPGGRDVYLRSRDGGLLAFAGLWDQHIPAGNGATIAYAVVSCMASAQTRSSEPLILAPEQYDAWLNEEDPRHLLTQPASHLVVADTPRMQPTGRAEPPLRATRPSASTNSATA
jgi:putative SOS response-associated peptidase YedK